MKHKSEARSLSWFRKEYLDMRLSLRPSFQRKPVWTAKQRCALIDSILQDIPVPEVYIQVERDDDDGEKFGVVDGQQRLSTILRFLGIERPADHKGEEDIDVNGFGLDTLDPQAEFFEITYADLSQDQREAFNQYQICVRLLYTSDRHTVEDVFKRLNKYSMPLKPQELRNATYHGAFAVLAEKLADDEYWAVNKIVTPAAIRRMADIEMMSDLLIGVMHGPQGGSTKVINEYYEQLEEFEQRFPEQRTVEQVFAQSKATIADLFPKIGETRWSNRTDYYSLFVALADEYQSCSIGKSVVAKLRDKLSAFAEQVQGAMKNGAHGKSPAAKYARAVEKGSNDKARRMDRHEVLIAILESVRAKKT